MRSYPRLHRLQIRSNALVEEGAGTPDTQPFHGLTTGHAELIQDPTPPEEQTETNYRELSAAAKLRIAVPQRHLLTLTGSVANFQALGEISTLKLRLACRGRAQHRWKT